MCTQVHVICYMQKSVKVCKSNQKQSNLKERTQKVCKRMQKVCKSMPNYANECQKNKSMFIQNGAQFATTIYAKFVTKQHHKKCQQWSKLGARCFVMMLAIEIP